MVLPGLGVLGDVDPELLDELAALGLPVRGVLRGDPFDPVSRAAARHYSGVEDLLGDARGPLRAVVLPASSPLAPALPELLAAGLPVLLTDPAPWDPDLLRDARAAAAERDVAAAVLLRMRHEGWARLVAGGLSGRPAPQQVLVRGWPRGAAAAAELVDLVRSWCGDVVAVAAAPAELPAAALSGGEPVVWALLTARGSTVLVAHEGSGPEVRLTLPSCRLVAGPGPGGWAVGWEGGEPVLPAAAADPTPAAFAAAVAQGTAERVGAGGDPDRVGPHGEERPWAADLYDLLPVAGVLAALRSSARSQAWTELG